MKSSIIIFLTICLIYSCRENSVANNKAPENDGDTTRFITHSYIELDKITKISKFRSGIGHDYWDDFEKCRSMKHYFVPFDTLDWTKIKIFSPVNGKIFRITDEGRGMQIKITPIGLSSHHVIIFHVNLGSALKEGDSVSSGQELGTHFSKETFSDIAVASFGSNQYKLLSYFDVLPDSLFIEYIVRGAKKRSDLIISKEIRDADPLNCNGDIFGTEGTIENWFNLK